MMVRCVQKFFQNHYRNQVIKLYNYNYKITDQISKISDFFFSERWPSSGQPDRHMAESLSVTVHVVVQFFFSDSKSFETSSNFLNQ